MAILEHEVQLANSVTLGGSQRHSWTREEFDRITKIGFFINQRLELIEGELLEMAPIGDAHEAINDPLADLLKKAFDDRFTVRRQSSISLGLDFKPSAPRPDIAVVVGNWREYLSRKPVASDVVLLVEIADSSLMHDRAIKAPLYASSGIAEYWIVNLVDNRVEVHRTPSEAGYSDIRICGLSDTIEPLSAPGGAICVADFMP